MLTFEFDEEYKESRKIAISNDSFDQNFSFILYGNFYEEASVDATYGPDDDIKALQSAYAITPNFRLMPMYDGNWITLVLTRLNVDQIAPDVWRVTVSYGPPDYGGGGPGGYDQPITEGPNKGDYDTWSNYFVQLSANVSASQETRTMSRMLVDKKKAVAAVNTNLPFTLLQPAPMGYSTEGVEGQPVYVRGFSFSLTAYFPPSKLTFAYVRRLFRMATTVNNATFFGFPAGSVLFLEASLSGDVFSLVPVTFDFHVRPNFKFSQAGPEVLMDPNQDDVTKMFDVIHDPWFADSPSGVTPFPGNAFSGWAVVDYGYAAKADDTAKVLYQTPIRRLVHNVYTTSNFDRFEL